MLLRNMFSLKTKSIIHQKLLLLLLYIQIICIFLQLIKTVVRLHILRSYKIGILF
uniref:Uncharacterized protein n=1 Tax=Anguilla anguilla TaxID=7936 RepID=A0A0E9URX9_ANGAN